MVSNTNPEARKVADEFARWVTFQYHDFKEFQTLFGGPERQHELLEKTAIDFFEDLFWMYIERIIQNISKLTDPPQTRGFNNFSIRHIHDYFKECCSYRTKAGDAEKIIKDIEDKAKKLRPWRNKLINHYDFDYATDKKVVSEKFFPKDIEDLYISLKKYVELLFSSVFDEVKSSIDMVTFHGVDELIRALKEARALRVLRDHDINVYHNLMSNSEFRDA